VTESRFALLVEQIDVQVDDLNEERDRLLAEADELLVERDRLLAARQVLVAGELPASAVPATARRERPAPRAASPATTPTVRKAKNSHPAKHGDNRTTPRDCPVAGCNARPKGGQGLSAHMRKAHPATTTQPAAAVKERHKMTTEQMEAGRAASQGDRECPVCHGTYGSAQALATHISLRHPAFKAAEQAAVPSRPPRPSIDEIQALEAVL
jgi:hypothetical protein